MSDTACGKNRLPFAETATPEQRACEQAAWDLFKNSCPGCATPTCTEQLYQQYLNSRAQCAQGE